MPKWTLWFRPLRKKAASQMPDFNVINYSYNLKNRAQKQMPEILIALPVLLLFALLFFAIVHFLDPWIVKDHPRLAEILNRIVLILGIIGGFLFIKKTNPFLQKYQAWISRAVALAALVMFPWCHIVGGSTLDKLIAQQVSPYSSMSGYVDFFTALFLLVFSVFALCIISYIFIAIEQFARLRTAGGGEITNMFTRMMSYCFIAILAICFITISSNLFSSDQKKPINQLIVASLYWDTMTKQCDSSKTHYYHLEGNDILVGTPAGNDLYTFQIVHGDFSQPKTIFFMDGKKLIPCDS